MPNVTEAPLQENQHSPSKVELLSAVRLAGRFLAPTWPLKTFIAINPLGGFEDRPFQQALQEANAIFGSRGTMPEQFYRQRYLEGRIGTEDLFGVLRRRGFAELEHTSFTLGERTFSGSELLLADLFYGVTVDPSGRSTSTLSQQRAPEVAALVDSQSAKWCAAFTGSEQATWKMPRHKHGFYTAWRTLAWRDHSLPKAARQRLRNLPAAQEDALLLALQELKIDQDNWRHYMQAHLAQMPGWATHIRWRDEHLGDFRVIDYLAMRFTYEAVFLADHDMSANWAATCQNTDTSTEPSPLHRAQHLALQLHAQAKATPEELTDVAHVLKQLPASERALIWLEAYEANYRDHLVEKLERKPTAHGRNSTERPAAQVVCCIDARSEGLRRQLETLGNYETLGFAGFFAVAIRYQDLAGGAPSALCPVLLTPQNEIHEGPASGAEDLHQRALSGHQTVAATQESFHAAKDDMLAPFALAEASGWAAGPISVMRTFAPRSFGALRERVLHRFIPSTPTSLNVQEGFTFEERSLFAEVALRMMGLTKNFAPLVVLCGHGATSENNPHESALDCGACGGNRGAPNARVAAAILNQDEIRAHLRTRDIKIPDDTVFIAAEHDTVKDTVQLLDLEFTPVTHGKLISQLDHDLNQAGILLSHERCSTLPGAPTDVSGTQTSQHVAARANHWSQVFPEWGLAGNAAFIVGPRSITKELNLKRRTFLHSYDADVDQGGEALETILTAPLVVAQWINCQYYFSTVDPDIFGAGTKTIHNVVGSVGVLAGHNGDLQLGLPWQSLTDGNQLIHEPMRLFALVQAPVERVQRIIEQNTILQHLFDNQWVALAARKQPEDPWLRYHKHGWEPWLNQEVKTQ